MTVSSENSINILIFLMTRSLLVKIPMTLVRGEAQEPEAVGPHDEELGFRVRASGLESIA